MEQSPNRNKMDRQDGTKLPLERVEEVTLADGNALVCTILYYTHTAIEASIEEASREAERFPAMGDGYASDENQEQYQEEQPSRKTTRHDRLLEGLKNVVLGATAGDRDLRLADLYIILQGSPLGFKDQAEIEKLVQQLVRNGTVKKIVYKGSSEVHLVACGNLEEDDDGSDGHVT